MASADFASRDPSAIDISRRSLLVGVGFAAAAGAAFAVTPRRHEATLGRSRLAEVIPTRIGPWVLADNGGIVLPESEQPSDVYDQVLARTYAGANVPPMMFLVAYGAAQSGLMKVHRPEICYTSSGFTISGDHAVDVPLAGGGPIAARSFLASRDDRSEQVLYWTRISDKFPRNLTSQRLLMLELGLRGVIPDGVLVRCSTMGEDPQSAQTAMVTFVEALIASASDAGRMLLIGAGARPPAGPGGTAATS